MGFMNAVLRTARFSTLLVRRGNKPNVSQQLLQSRMLTMTRCWRSQDKPETVNLDSWKAILRSGAQSPAIQNESESQEESSIETMQKLVDMWRLVGVSVPDSMATEEFQELLALPTKSARKKYLKELFFKECRKRNKDIKKLEKQKLRSEVENSTENHNTYFIKVWNKSENIIKRWQAVQAMIHGQPIICDMLYDRYMSKKEMENTISQLMLCEGFNKSSVDPFHMHFCNLKPDGPYHKELLNRYGTMWDNLLVTATEKSPVDIFPKEQLVYLTADSPNVLKTFDHRKIYIVGAFVDKSQKTGVSLAIAKRLNLATARLPLEKYLKWDIGAKNLTLNQVIEILITLKDTGDWKKALSYVPTRKHLGFVQKFLSPSDAAIGRKESRGLPKITKINSPSQKQEEWLKEKSE